jgi:hypothetical protein
MPRETLHSSSSLSRRAALGGVGATAATIGLGHVDRVTAQEATPSALAGHPMAGMWLAMANPPLPGDPQVPVPSLLAADGTVLLVFPVTQKGPQGVQFNSAYVGTWEPETERRAHFTATQLLSAADGTFLGSVTVDGHPEASADGQRFVDDNALVMVTIRDAAGAVVQQVSGAGAPPVTGIRMAPGAPGFPERTASATPTT